METIAFIVGVVLAVIGLGLSIAFHELGHLSFAKLFGVRVLQYMIGFGPTLFSKRKGETEYGIKLFPLGGYISMIGMYPPACKPATAADGEQIDSASAKSGNGIVRRVSVLFEKIIEHGRGASFAHFCKGEECRTFYNLSVWKRLLVMFAGPFANLILAFVFFAIVISGFGIYTPQTSVAAVSACSGKWLTNNGSGVRSSGATLGNAGAHAGHDEDAAARGGDRFDELRCSRLDPAAASGILPGDVIRQVSGKQVNSWDDVVRSIQNAKGDHVEFIVQRNGQELHFDVLPRLNAANVAQSEGATSAGARNFRDRDLHQQGAYFVGISPNFERERRPIVDVFSMISHQVVAVVGVVLTMPQRVADMFASAFLGKDRDPNGPMSIVGVGRLTGEVAQRNEISIVDRAATIVQILAAVNVALAIMNLIPLPPLDGGHIFAALWDGVRRRLWRLCGARDPGPFDTAKLLPVSYIGAALLLLMGALFIFADFVNPIKFFG